MKPSWVSSQFYTHASGPAGICGIGGVGMEDR